MILKMSECSGEILLQVCNHNSTPLISATEILMDVVDANLSLLVQNLRCIMGSKVSVRDSRGRLADLKKKKKIYLSIHLFGPESRHKQTQQPLSSVPLHESSRFSSSENLNNGCRRGRGRACVRVSCTDYRED